MCPPLSIGILYNEEGVNCGTFSFKNYKFEYNKGRNYLHFRYTMEETIYTLSKQWKTLPTLQFTMEETTYTLGIQWKKLPTL